MVKRFIAALLMVLCVSVVASSSAQAVAPYPYGGVGNAIPQSPTWVSQYGQIKRSYLHRRICYFGFGGVGSGCHYVYVR